MTQRLDFLPPVPQHTTPPKSPPRQAKTTKSSRTASSGSVPAVPPTHHGLALPGYGYPTHGSGVTSQRGTVQSRSPNVTINPSLMQYNAMQYNAYNAAMLNPALVSHIFNCNVKIQLIIICGVK